MTKFYKILWFFILALPVTVFTILGMCEVLP